jgi:subtilisin-like proprotein convertase family protein
MLPTAVGSVTDMRSVADVNVFVGLDHTAVGDLIVQSPSTVFVRSRLTAVSMACDTSPTSLE